ncbi:MAG: hypothetical protein M3303_04645 [Gemmatimonadota bacterium]|nr:hypothetical protein [Gemmatimonadota bacterium]
MRPPPLVLVALLCSGCGAPRSAEEATAAAGLLGPLVAEVTKGARSACRIADRRVGRPSSRRTRVCTYPEIPGLLLWIHPEDMAQPVLSYRSQKVADTSAAAATRDSLLRPLQSSGQQLRLRDCARRVPQRRFILSVTQAEALGAELTFQILREPDSTYSLHMQASPTGAAPQRCDPSLRRAP